jgi:hypothetical protein
MNTNKGRKDRQEENGNNNEIENNKKDRVRGK